MIPKALRTAAGRVEVLAPDGTRVSLSAGRRLTFGRGRGADVFVPLGRDLSRDAGEIVALAHGAWIENLSRTHALYVRGDGYHIRLPPAGDDGPPGGWLVSRGIASVGSMAMIRNELALTIIVATGADITPITAGPAGARRSGGEDSESTVRPLQLRPDTKLFLIALLLCRPWLVDPSHTTALPTAPQIARAALECASACRELSQLAADPRFRTGLIGQVNDHLKYLRERVRAGGLAPAGTRLTPAVIAQALIANDVITAADLAYLADPAWQSLQEDLWWKAGAA